jgi:hypothetical protein
MKRSDKVRPEDNYKFPLGEVTKIPREIPASKQEFTNNILQALAMGTVYCLAIFMFVVILSCCI